MVMVRVMVSATTIYMMMVPLGVMKWIEGHMMVVLGMMVVVMMFVTLMVGKCSLTFLSILGQIFWLLNG